MRRTFQFFMLLPLCLIIVSSSPGQVKKRVAVAEFSNKSGYRGAGEGVSDMLTTALVKSGEFVVIERKELGKIMEEQHLGASGQVTPETAAKVGKLLGADLLVLGSLSELGTKDRAVSGGSNLFGAAINAKSARAAVDIRLVNSTTGEVIASETEEGTESTIGLGGSYKGINFSDFSKWNDTDLGKAAREAIDKCVELIRDNMAKVPWSGRILKANADGTVIMKPGSDGNVKEGMEFDVYRAGEQLKDPDTGLVLGAEEEKVGRIKVEEDMLDGKAAKARVIDGKDLQVGDYVREPKG